MAVLGGLFLKISQTTLRALTLLASCVVLAVYSYFLAALANNDVPISNRYKAIEGISGAAVLYGIFGVLLTLCLGGLSFFALIAIVLDILFAGAFVAVTIYTREGARSCSGIVNTPLGSGPSNAGASVTNGQDNFVTLPNLGQACRLNKAAFACAIMNIGLFLITAVFQVLLVRHHKREKRFGPSPANNYTAGSGRRRFWRRNKRNTRDAELATAGHHEKHGIRPSHDTAYTGTTVDNHYGHPATTSTNY